MKIRYLLPILVLAVHTAKGATFKLPKDAPQFSIDMPDNWITETKGDTITSRPSKESPVIFSVFPAAGAKNLTDAFALATKQACEGYSDCKFGRSSQEKEKKMQFMGAEATAKKDGADIRIWLYVFSPDGQLHFAVTRAFDVASGEKYGKQIDGVMDSIRSLIEEARKAKEESDNAESKIAFPKDKPAFTMQVRNSFGIDNTAERLIVGATKQHKSFLYFADVPAGDGVSDEASAKAWVPRKVKALFAALGVKEVRAFEDWEIRMYDIAGHKGFELGDHFVGDIEELRLWVFTPDGTRYFYAYYQEKSADSYQDADAFGLGSWQDSLISSIKQAK
jgi:hypothetical protein